MRAATLQTPQPALCSIPQWWPPVVTRVRHQTSSLSRHRRCFCARSPLSPCWTLRRTQTCRRRAADSRSASSDTLPETATVSISYWRRSSRKTWRIWTSVHWRRTRSSCPLRTRSPNTVQHQVRPPATHLSWEATDPSENRDKTLQNIHSWVISFQNLKKILDARTWTLCAALNIQQDTLENVFKV